MALTILGEIHSMQCILGHQHKPPLNYHKQMVTEGSKTKILLLFPFRRKTAHIKYPCNSPLK